MRYKIIEYNNGVCAVHREEKDHGGNSYWEYAGEFNTRKDANTFIDLEQRKRLGSRIKSEEIIDV